MENIWHRREDSPELFESSKRAKQSLGGENDDLVLCTVSKNDSKNMKRKVSFTEDDKLKILHVEWLPFTH